MEICLTVSYPGPFLQLGHHDYDGTSLLPDHPPEFTKCLWQGSLGGNVGILLPVAVNVVCVDVIASRDAYIKKDKEKRMVCKNKDWLIRAHQMSPNVDAFYFSFVI